MVGGSYCYLAARSLPEASSSGRCGKILVARNLSELAIWLNTWRVAGRAATCVALPSSSVRGA